MAVGSTLSSEAQIAPLNAFLIEPLAPNNLKLFVTQFWTQCPVEFAFSFSLALPEALVVTASVVSQALL